VVAAGWASTMRVAWVGLVGLVACSSKPRPEDAVRGGRDAPAGSAVSDASAPGSAAAPPADAAGRDALPGAPVGGATGDLQIRVEWANVPVAARSSPGRTPCNTPRAPSVAPTTTWGIPDALVVINGAAPPATIAHITLADCTLSPRVAIGASLAVTSAVERPAKLVLRKRGTLDQLVAGDPISVMLPIAGHTVTAAIDAGAIYSLETDAAEPEIAFIASVSNGYVTEANGQVIAYHLIPGVHTATAWLPPRAGQPARVGHGTARVVAGDLTALTIRLGP